MEPQPLIRRYLYLALVLVCAAAGCTESVGKSDHSAGHSGQSANRLHVVCTTGMVADMVREVGGDQVQVVALMGPGVDPHLYKASPRDVQELQRADVVFYSGLHLEGKMTQVLENMARKKPCVAITSVLPRDRLLQPNPGFPDPHVWFDVDLWSQTIPAVEQTLSKEKPAHASEFHDRALAYQKQLQELHAECRQKIGEISPPERRVLVTAHDAFEYFGRAYSLEVKAIQGLSTESEAGVREINDLVSFIVERKLKAVFIETSLSDRNIKSLVEGCQQAGQTVKIGGELYSDALGAPDSPAGTYLGMVRENVATITAALR